MADRDTEKQVMLSARIPAEFHKQVKLLCVERGISIQEFVYQALREKYKKEAQE
jgi:predicted HicB family RNase H-like nuclease